MDTIMKPRRTEEEAMLKRMEQIAREATDEDRRKVEEIVRRATGSAHDCAIITFTPGMGAILFLHHNTHNRTWKLDMEAIKKSMRNG